MNKLTLVIGASENPGRYANQAVRMLRENNIPVAAVGLKAGEIQDVKIQTGFPKIENIHTVTLYVGPKNQPSYYDYILSLKPKRVVFNPGTENDEFQEKIEKAGIEAIEACTLVMLSVGNY